MRVAVVHCRAWWCGILLVTMLGCSRHAQPIECGLPQYAALDYFPSWGAHDSCLAYYHGALADTDTAGVYVINIYTMQRKRVVATSFGIPKGIAFSSDGRTIVASLGGELFVIMPYSGSARQITSTSGAAWWPALTSDASHIAYVRVSRAYNEPGRVVGLHTFDLATGLDSPLGPDTISSWQTDSPPAWRDADRSILVATTVTSARSGYTNIALVDSAGALLSVVCAMRGVTHNPIWIERDQTVLFDLTRLECPQFDLDRSMYSAHSDGTALSTTPILGDVRMQFGFPVAVSRDGRSVASVRPDPSGRVGVLWLSDRNGSNEHQLTGLN